MPDAGFDVSMASIKKLVNGFREHILALRAPQTLEATIRHEYIDPFWIALGWDVSNRALRSHAEKDVVIEAPVGTIEQERMRSRRPDYLFRVGGFPRFVVEAKKPAVDIASDKESIFQAKTYAWSAQIPFAVLTDFEEFRVYDSTIKPYFGEPNRGLIEEFSLRFEDYVGQWDVLFRTFGRQSVVDGSLENLLARLKKVRAGKRVRGSDRLLFDLRGTEPVDRVFLAHLEDYRLRFARTIFEENRSQFPEADTRHGAAKLTEAAQRLVDRIVFLRVCEDRGITSYGGLREVLNDAAAERSDPYTALVARFREFDSIYNGYLFKAHFSEQLRIPPDVLADFIRSLYLPEGPYRFDAIGDDLLGIIYERFLGSAIAVLKGRVTAEEKPEVRHAGGVYYTPRFVVDAIIRRVVGPQIEGKSPDDVLNVKILDPACGSGSFLIAAYQYLIDYCTSYFTEHPEAATAQVRQKNGKKKQFDRAFRERDGQWHLAPDFRTRLLTSCIYGVDIDGQAVEVSIMSLYLKALEGKLPDNWQRKWVDERLLPPLDNNVLCGNSLLSQTDFDDYWDKKHGSLFAGDEDVRFRINAFDWTSYTRGFGRLFAEHQGFDCIVGNPPYIRVQELNKWAPDECEFYKSRYKSAAKGNFDIYVVFIERCLELLSENGLLGVISPHKYWQATYGAGLRKLIAEGKHLRSIIDFTDQQVFRNVTTYTAIQVFSKSPNRGMVDYARISKLIDGEAQCRGIVEDYSRKETTSRWRTHQPITSTAPFRFAPKSARIIEPSTEHTIVKLSEVADLAQGFKTGADGVYVVKVVKKGKVETLVTSKATGSSHRIETTLLRPLLKSEHMRKYAILESDLALLFPYEVRNATWRLFSESEMRRRFPLAWNDYLNPLRSTLKAREGGRFDGDRWYQYSRQQNFVPLSKPKIIVPDMADHVRFSFDDRGRYVFSGGAAGGNAIIPNAEVSALLLLGILNSKLIEHQLRHTGTLFRGGWLNCEIRFLRNLPIKIPRSKEEKSLAERICQRVTRLLQMNHSLRGVHSDRFHSQQMRELEAHEQAIDKLVLELYGVDELPDE